MVPPFLVNPGRARHARHVRECRGFALPVVVATRTTAGYVRVEVDMRTSPRRLNAKALLALQTVFLRHTEGGLLQLGPDVCAVDQVPKAAAAEVAAEVAEIVGKGRLPWRVGGR